MSPLPIAHGEILQKRFRIVQILGQGGFGRTYLALDEQRFNEQCAIKEYIPIKGDEYTLSKSKELFQREAATLYQIQHPQIPSFRAIFEENARLFFVQDFIQGKPYSHLLQDRLKQGETFSEEEALHFLDRLLPVLSYIHSQNLIHRDISPDNLILRDSDRLPVLIDFGVVKLAELEKSLAPQGTAVGKSGYSPIEQLKTGKTYPSSDLYALAVTVIVLLTGKHPEYLFDEMTCSWQWAKYLPTLNPQFTSILKKMLSDRPQYRYQSADEVLAALAPLLQQIRQFPSTDLITALPLNSSNLRSSVITVAPTQPDRSGYKTQRRSPASTVMQSHNSIASKSSSPKNLGLWIAAISLGIITSALSILFFINANSKSNQKNSIAVSSNTRDSINETSTQNVNAISPSPSPSNTVTSQPSKAIAPISGTSSQNVNVPTQATPKSNIATSQPTIINTPPSETLPQNSPVNNSSYIVSDQIFPNQPKQYNIEGASGRGIFIKLLSGKLSKISILHPDGSVPPGDPNLLMGSGRYFFPDAGTYTITVLSNEASNFSFEVWMIKGKAPNRP
ncbi:protein kinase [Pseudanabaena sp. FACHB-1998]|uniref:serine/threonine-protein kinase n=1 Tax=Pseudanabaena sp. FACHB-1998 TaxID=2692858 RepID=UPI0016806B61|nr:serine/threonine-protein kinase [Pseudanabaena sp. FACHB-1998]MBD2177452.1 protein kinase [Pseudanabaena sp. FACHB-1998]